MAKSSYGITTPLNRSWLDYPVPLSQSFRPPTKQLLFYLGAVMVIIWLAAASPFARGGVVAIVLMLAWCLPVAAFLGTTNRTGELRVRQLFSLVGYLPRVKRRIITRRGARPADFYGVVGIEDVEDSGRIHFADGSQGQMYAIVGSASYLLFDEDRAAILNRVDAFWRKVDSSCEWLWMTTREPQRVHHQVASLEEDNQNLVNRHPDLVEMTTELYDVLTEHVGGQFSSIHQYLLLRAKNEDALFRAHSTLLAEVEGSALMVKEATMLEREQSLTALAALFQGIPDEINELFAHREDTSVLARGAMKEVRA